MNCLSRCLIIVLCTEHVISNLCKLACSHRSALGWSGEGEGGGAAKIAKKKQELEKEWKFSEEDTSDEELFAESEIDEASGSEAEEDGPIALNQDIAIYDIAKIDAYAAEMAMEGGIPYLRAHNLAQHIYHSAEGFDLVGVHLLNQGRQLDAQAVPINDGDTIDVLISPLPEGTYPGDRVVGPGEYKFGTEA